MGTSLTGLTPSTTYDALIKVGDNGALSATAKVLSDGLGNDSVLALSTSKVFVNTTTSHGTLTIEQPVSEVGLVVNSGTASAPTLYLRDAGGAGYSEILANNKLYINSVNVGIGTSSPSDKLNLLGTDTTAYVSSSASAVLPAGGSNLVIQNNGTAGYSSLRFVSLDGSNAFGYLGFINSTGVSGSFVFGQRTGGNSYAEQMRLSNDGYLRLAGGGIQFNGDTAAANALDDYEEGTWTMGISFNGNSVGATYANNTGTYTKIGRQVTVNGLVEFSNKGTSTGLAAISGLPFPIGSAVANYVAGSAYFGAVTFLGQFQVFAISSESRVRLRDVSSLGVISDLNETNFANNSTVMIGLTYFV